jgi:hypothetical protein
MPYKLKWGKDSVIGSFSGSFTFQESNRAQTEIYNDQRSNDLRYVIWDLSDISKQLATKSEAQAIATIDNVVGSRLNDIKIAFVAVDDASRLFFGHYSIQAINYGTSWEFQIFDTLEKAKSWCTT